MACGYQGGGGNCRSAKETIETADPSAPARLRVTAKIDKKTLDPMLLASVHTLTEQLVDVCPQRGAEQLNRILTLMEKVDPDDINKCDHVSTRSQFNGQRRCSNPVGQLPSPSCVKALSEI